ncbi:MAG: hypothetical protein AAFO93_12800 [Pseudomonadota bacterium]
MNLIIYILRAPWWCQFLFAGLIAWAGYAMNDKVAADQEALAVALASPEPEAVTLNAHMENPRELPLREGRVVAQIATEYNYRLIERTNGVKTDESRMFVLFDPSASEDAKVVSAVIILKPRQVDAFSDWAVSRMVGFGAFGATFDFHGSFKSSHSDSGLARDAMDEAGLTPTAGMVYITPYLEGREAGLEATAANLEAGQYTFYIIAAVFAAYGVFRLVLMRSLAGISGGRRRGPAPLAPVTTAGRTPAPMMPEARLSDAAAANPRHVPQPAPVAGLADLPGLQGGVGPKATRAAKLVAAQESARAEPAPMTAAPAGPGRQMSALEQARAFRQKASAGATSFKQKMKQDPFAKLAEQN